MGCPLQPDLVNTSCSVSCAPDAVRACGRAIHLTHELTFPSFQSCSTCPPGNALHPPLSLESDSLPQLLAKVRDLASGVLRAEDAMARLLRLECGGAVHHVTSCGDACLSIFLVDPDRRLFLDVLGDLVERSRWGCHGYCLMTDHYHLLVETPEADLSSGMRHLRAPVACLPGWALCDRRGEGMLPPRAASPSQREAVRPWVLAQATGAAPMCSANASATALAPRLFRWTPSTV